MKATRITERFLEVHFCDRVGAVLDLASRQAYVLLNGARKTIFEWSDDATMLDVKKECYNQLIEMELWN